MSEGSESELTELAAAIEAKERKSYKFDVHGVLGLGKKPILRVAIHDPDKDEDEAALKDAHSRVESFSEGLDALKNDEDLLNDAKGMAIIQRAVHVEDDSMQAFPGVAWIRKHMTGHQIGFFVRSINEVRSKAAREDWDMSSERIDTIVRMCVRAAETDIPERILGRYQREFLSSLVVLLALRVYRESRPGVTVDKDKETGRFVLRYADGTEPEWPPLDESAIDEDDDVAEASADEHEQADG